MAQRTFTTDELMQAFTARRRADWPETFEQAMNDRMFKNLICIEARRRAMQSRQRTTQQHATRPALALPHSPPVFDLKRRAAGEREDD